MKKFGLSLVTVGFAVFGLMPAAHADTASVQAQLQALLNQLSQLQSQVNGTTASPAATPALATVSNNLFVRNLTIGSQGTDVSALQQVLITDGYLTAISVPTGYFGPATKNALIAYQQAKGISPATGFFGPLTRANLSTVSTVTNTTQGSAMVNSSAPTTTPAPQPTANLQANGSTGAILIPYGSSVTLTWSSSNADSCNISPAELTGTSGDQTIANLTANQIYSLTCIRGNASAVSSVTVDVAAQSQNNTSPTTSQPSQTSPTATSNGTVSQQNALRAAQQYLNYTAFSHDGLVAQLVHDQFSQADATYGADNSGADWNAEAIKAAQSYLGYTAFSHDGLVAQLVHDQFTQSQAVYGADNSGGNWNAEAAKAAQQYMSYSAFSQGSLIAQLEYDKFTSAQAAYGANAVGL